MKGNQFPAVRWNPEWNAAVPSGIGDDKQKSYYKVPQKALETPAIGLLLQSQVGRAFEGCEFATVDDTEENTKP